jgi:GTPase Era involved in 16S rRNA processing
LSDYKQIVFKVTQILHDLDDFAVDLELKQLELETKQVIEKLSNNSFSIAVVGEFKRGKSTFVNALLGVDILPADVLPTTATINRVTYGLTAKANIIFRDGQKEFIELRQLKDYVTNLTLESSQKALVIKEAVVYYPIAFCRDNNLEIIDTPGLQDSDNLTEITYSVLSQIDAAIFVMMAQSPLSATELNFLTETLLTQDLGKVMFVITGIDLCPSVEAATKLITYIKQRLQQKILEYAQSKLEHNSPQYHAYLHKIAQLKVFSISASLALEGKISGNEELLKQSNIKVFETALRNFLEQEKGLIVLLTAVNKAIALCQTILETTQKKQQYYQQQQGEFAQIYQKAIASLTTQETNYRRHLSSSALAEIAKIHEQKVEKRVKWEKAKVIIEIKQKKLQKIATETHKMLVEVESIAQYLRSLQLKNSIDMTSEQICHNCGKANQQVKFCIYCGTQI